MFLLCPLSLARRIRIPLYYQRFSDTSYRKFFLRIDRRACLFYQSRNRTWNFRTQQSIPSLCTLVSHVSTELYPVRHLSGCADPTPSVSKITISLWGNSAQRMYRKALLSHRICCLTVRFSISHDSTFHQNSSAANIGNSVFTQCISHSF